MQVFLLTMKTINLKAFLQSGQFDTVRLGMEKEEVENILGTPDDWMIANKERNRKENTPIWRYGNIEFHFDFTNKLVAIFNDYLASKSIHGGLNLQIETWIFNHPEIQTLREVKDVLEENAIFFRVRKGMDQQQMKLRLYSGVCLLFRDEDDDYNIIEDPEDFLLYAFEYRQPKVFSSFSF